MDNVLVLSCPPEGPLYLHTDPVLPVRKGSLGSSQHAIFHKRESRSREGRDGPKVTQQTELRIRLPVWGFAGPSGSWISTPLTGELSLPKAN